MRSHRFATVLLPVAVTPLLLAGCSSSSAADAEAEKKDTFCTEVPALLGDITDDLQRVTATPEQAPQLLTEAVDRISAVEPPADVTPQWQRLVTAWTSMRDLLAQADLTDPAANADLAPQMSSLQTELVDSGTAVDDYGKANC
jgi:outer membrane murein-binding lipoprotein Lpp